MSQEGCTHTCPLPETDGGLPTSSTSPTVTSFPSLISVLALTIVLALFCCLCHGKKTAMQWESYEPVAGVIQTEPGRCLMPHHELGWYLANEATYMGLHSCGQPTDRGTPTGTISSDSNYRDPQQRNTGTNRATTAGYYQHILTRLTINTYNTSLQQLPSCNKTTR